MCSDKKSVFCQIKKIIKGGRVLKNQPLANHTTFKVGGNAKYFVEVNSLEEIILLIELFDRCKVKYFVLGGGSNVLFSDNGYDGVVLKIRDKFSKLICSGNKIIAYSGASLNQLCRFACENSLSGLEDGFGIPGTVGGSVYMNASAYTFKTHEVVTSVLALVNGKIKLFSNSECEFAYRSSVFNKYNNAIILRVEYTLQKGKQKVINKKMLYTMQARKTNQPLNYPSAGCVFKNIEGHKIGKMIDDEGFKGYRIGDAEVSEKHANFIINIGNASANDILQIIEHIKTHFKNKFNLQLSTEIKYIE